MTRKNIHSGSMVFSQNESQGKAKTAAVLPIV
jgi:hypothetical protein